MLTLLLLGSDVRMTNCFCFVTKALQTRTSSVIYLCVLTPKILASQSLCPSNKLQS